MWGVFFTKLTEFTHLKTIFKSFLILMRIVIDLFAHSTFELNHVVLRHTGRNSKIVLGV